ncbi:hypothetical protein [Candidatus Binatus sp.]|jgi:hypothetical protein|uniref:hypothetical protein n=1 Tax=Candidatus Binatus sp. TaxID=2811406 RepID=UPI002FD8CF8D
MKKFAIAATSVALGAIFAFSVGIPCAYAASTVDCDAVMQGVRERKPLAQIASDMNISPRSLEVCWQKPDAAAKAPAQAQTEAAEPSTAEGEPGAAPSVAAPPSN